MMNQAAVLRNQLDYQDKSRGITPISDRAPESSSVAVLLCTYNGEPFLTEQLESLLRQTHKNWVIYASDDGSTDSTKKILRGYQKKLGCDRFVLLDGPQQGFANNFVSLIRNRKIKADYFAFCDQDDIWYEDKLERSLRRLSRYDKETPALFCSRTRLVDEAGQPIGFSPLFDKCPSFQNALVQSLAGANTMLLNQAARELFLVLGEDTPVVSHDWLAYLLVTGCGGAVFYDAKPSVSYRQHGDNLMGCNSRPIDRLHRLYKMFAGTFRDWTEMNLLALHDFRERLTPEGLLAMEQFMRSRESGLFQRMVLLRQSGVYRQSLFGNAGLILASGIRRI